MKQSTLIVGLVSLPLGVSMVAGCSGGPSAGVLPRVDGVDLTHERTVTVTDTLAEGATVFFDLEDGDVQLAAGEGDAVELTVTFYEFSLGDAELAWSGDRLTSSTTSARPIVITSVRGTVPGGPAQVRTGDGAVALTGLGEGGEVRVTTGTGDVTLTGCVAERIDVATGSGEVAVEGGTAARLRVQAHAGDVAVTGGEYQRASIDTHAGAVSASGLAARRLAVRTQSGDADVTGGTIGTLRFDTRGGELSLVDCRPDTVELESTTLELNEASAGDGGSALADDSSGSVASESDDAGDRVVTPRIIADSESAE